MSHVPSISTRMRGARAVTAGLFTLLVLRFFQFQVLQADVYQIRSNRNHIRQISLRAARGVIYDRKDRVLADNKPSYALFVVPHLFQENPLDQEIVASAIRMPVDSIRRKIRESGTGPFMPVRLLRDIDFSLLSRIQESRIDLPGLVIEHEPVRRYPAGNTATHVLGFTGEIGPQELTARRSDGYRRGDVIGKSGVEKVYESELRGQKGFRYVEVDVRGREVGDLDGDLDKPPRVGRSLRLTLDLDLQQALEASFPDARGAAVALDPNTGEVLAMISRPAVDLMRFTSPTSSALWHQIITDTTHPLMNRAIQSQLPPGSTFKIVSALAALSDPAFHPEDTVICEGGYVLGGKRFDCWRPEGHGPVDLTEAIRKSCNVYFYHTALNIDWNKWFDQAGLLGFGRRTGIDLYGETPGLLPGSDDLAAETHHRNPSKGAKLNWVIGQGDLLVTPIQMAVLGAVIASGGRLVRPHVVQAVQDENGVWRFPSINAASLNIPEKRIALIKGGMRLAALPGGTAVRAAVPGQSVCGKTGTAQNPHGRPHAWFLGFAPAEHPEIVVVVVLEEQGSGGAAAAPVAREVFSQYLTETGG